jgi:hypothetical protein
MAARAERQRGDRDEELRRQLSALRDRWNAEDQRQRQTVDELRRARARIEHAHSTEQERRRTEDRIREELHDSHAITIKGSRRAASR